jgi:hypothetical protein
MNGITDEMEEVLRAYTRLQRQEQELKEQKRVLQEKLKAFSRGGAGKVWYPVVDQTRLKVSYRRVPQMEYDEQALRKRLGKRYRDLLEPDIRKLRAELPNIKEELKFLLDRIGSPSPEKVKAAMKSGTVSANEFKGAFTRIVKEYVSVATLQPND